MNKEKQLVAIVYKEKQKGRQLVSIVYKEKKYENIEERRLINEGIKRALFSSNSEAVDD